MKEVAIPGKDKDRAWQSVWEIEEVPGVASRSRSRSRSARKARLYDTVLVRYHLLEPRQEATHGRRAHVADIFARGQRSLAILHTADRESARAACGWGGSL